jgi:predicted PurR-regulated permease PerM
MVIITGLLIIIIALLCFFIYETMQVFKEVSEMNNDYIQELTDENTKIHKMLCNEQAKNELIKRTIEENANGSITNLINRLKSIIDED